jgi:asparagine synthase (glutamine-hydrolysing)
LCGFHFIWSREGSINEKKAIEAALESRYRGPDHQAFEMGSSNTGDSYFFLANRLAITGSFSARQPLRSEDGRYLFALNGEIYNYHSLGHQLGLSSFDTDSEVAFKWLMEHSYKGLQQFEGLFSLLLLDLKSNTWFAAKDRFSSRPLYYSPYQGGAIVSSTVDFILKYRDQKPQISPVGLRQYYRFHFTASPHTLWKEVLSLGTGEILRSPLTVQSWEEPNQEPNLGSANLSINVLLNNAIRKQRYTPSALLLSGGIDSGLLLRSFEETESVLPHLYHVNTGNNDEWEKASYLAKKLKVPLHQIHAKDQSTPDTFERFLSSIDYPIGDSGFFLTWLVCKVMDPTIKVVYSGAGADELTAGYRRHLYYYWVSKLPETLKPLTTMLGLWKEGGNLSSTTWDFRDLLARSSVPAELNAFANALETDFKNYLSHDVLMMTDQAAMLQGKEIRLPFLDEAFVNALMPLSLEQKLSNGRKGILKEAWKKAYPNIPVLGRKVGFGIAKGDFLESCLGESYDQWATQHQALFEDIEKSAGIGPYRIYRKTLHQWAMVILAGYLKRYL